MEITERRYSQPQLNRAAGQPSRVVSGVAVRFGALSEDFGGWRERIAPGAFAASLKAGHDVRMLHSHDTGRILGSTRAGTLKLAETASGLTFRCDLPKTSDGDDVLELCRRGDLREMSFGFTCKRESWGDEDLDDYPDDLDRSRRTGRKKTPVRTVHEAFLAEISAVAWPAYAGGATSIRPELVAAAATASRSLFPSGAVPIEIRSRFPAILVIDAEQQEQDARARQFLTHIAALE
jgi:HK97 family phage prohead protease